MYAMLAAHAHASSAVASNSVRISLSFLCKGTNSPESFPSSRKDQHRPLQSSKSERRLSQHTSMQSALQLRPCAARTPFGSAASQRAFKPSFSLESYARRGTYSSRSHSHKQQAHRTSSDAVDSTPEASAQLKHLDACESAQAKAGGQLQRALPLLLPTAAALLALSPGETALCNPVFSQAPRLLCDQS